MMGPACRYHAQIECTDRRNCEKCGWNPKVERRRKIHIQEARSKLPEPNKGGIVRCEDCLWKLKGHTYCPVQEREVALDEFCVSGVRRGKG